MVAMAIVIALTVCLRKISQASRFPGATNDSRTKGPGSRGQRIRPRLRVLRDGAQFHRRHSPVRRRRLGPRWLGAHAAAVHDRRRVRGRVRRVHEHLLPREKRHGGKRRGTAQSVKPLILLLGFGLALAVIAAGIGGKPAALGGGVAVIAQLWAVALLRPKMRAPNPEFMARWLGGIGIRFLALGALVVWIITHRAAFPALPAVLGYFGVLLPLLSLETRFLR